MTICVLAKPMRMLLEIISAANRKTQRYNDFLIAFFQPFFDVILLIVLPSYFIPSSRSVFVLFRVIFRTLQFCFAVTVSLLYRRIILLQFFL